MKFAENGKLKLLIIVGTRPEIIRLAATINKCRKYFDVILAHTGQNYDYNLNGVFFKDLCLADPEVYMDAVGDDLGATVGNIINCSYKLMVDIRPDALLILGDTNSCLSAIAAKRLHIPIFHMEAGNRCKDECLPEETNRRIVDIISDVNLCYSEHARRYLADCGLPKERTYVTGSPMAEVLHQNLKEIEASDSDLKKANTSCSRPTARKTSTPRKISSRCSTRLMQLPRNMTCPFSTVATREAANASSSPASSSTIASSVMNRSASTTTTAFR